METALLMVLLLWAAISDTSSFAVKRNSQRPIRTIRQDAVSSPENDPPVDWPVFKEDGSSSDLDEDDMGNVYIPSTGISVSDEMEADQKERFVTEVVPVKGLPGVAQLVTEPLMRASFDPVRYLVALTPPPAVTEDSSTAAEMIPTSNATTYALVDVPPFSPQLATRMQAFMGAGSRLTTILVTSRDAIHYDETPSVYTVRRSDLDLWKRAFPDAEIVAYRLDIPRDCRSMVSQCLDGYGPFALDESTGNATFVETGRPLTILEWDHDVAQSIFKGNLPPDDDDDDDDAQGNAAGDDLDYSPEGIRAREQDKRILAVFTPGHTFGSMTYIFPETKVCCSGFTIPVEDSRSEENVGIEGAGPALDYRGYITTSRGGIGRQMQSARTLVNSYSDRFEVVLPSRGDPLFVDTDAKERKKELLDIIIQYDRIGKIYEELGIMDSGGEE